MIVAKTRSSVAPLISTRGVYDLARVTDRGAVRRTFVKRCDGGIESESAATRDVKREAEITSESKRENRKNLPGAL